MGESAGAGLGGFHNSSYVNADAERMLYITQLWNLRLQMTDLRGARRSAPNASPVGKCHGQGRARVAAPGRPPEQAAGWAWLLGIS